MIDGKQIMAGSTTVPGNPDSEPFDVNTRSEVIYLVPSSGDTLSEDDTYELRRVVAWDENGDPSQSIKINDEGTAVLLGANNPHFEVVIRGTYIVRKILATTETVSVKRTYGNDEGA